MMWILCRVFLLLLRKSFIAYTTKRRCRRTLIVHVHYRIFIYSSESESGEKIDDRIGAVVKKQESRSRKNEFDRRLITNHHFLEHTYWEMFWERPNGELSPGIGWHWGLFGSETARKCWLTISSIILPTITITHCYTHSYDARWTIC